MLHIKQCVMMYFKLWAVTGPITARNCLFAVFGETEEGRIANN